MPELKKKPTLGDLQKYIEAVCCERGWNRDSHLVKFLLFSEEIGELAKAMRKVTKLYAEPSKYKETELEKRRELEGEFADVLNYLLDLANHFDIDLEAAFRAKEEVNKKRKWAQ